MNFLNSPQDADFVFGETTDLFVAPGWFARIPSMTWGVGHLWSIDVVFYVVICLAVHARHPYFAM